MPSKSRARIECLKSKWLCLSGFNDFKEVNIHAHTKLLEFVDECNVYATVDILEQFRHLGSLRR